MATNNALAAAWVTEVGIITVRDLATDHRPPLPSELLSSFAVYGALAIVAIPAPKAAIAVGWGLVVATLLASQIDFLGPVGDFMSGRFAKPGSAPSNAPAPDAGGAGAAAGGSVGAVGW